MRLDAQLSFVPIGSSFSLVGAAGIGFASPTTIDLLGQGVGTAPLNIIGDTLTTGFNSGNFGTDLGIGRYKPMTEVIIGSTFTTANGATLNVQFQGATDTGATGNYQPGTWQTFVETGTLTAAQLILPAGLGSGVVTASPVIARFDFPPSFPPGFSPRYLRLFFSIATGTNFTAGTIAAAIVTTVRDDLAQKYAAKNFIVQ
jgi:hypothetical protein